MKTSSKYFLSNSNMSLFRNSLREFFIVLLNFARDWGEIVRKLFQTFFQWFIQEIFQGFLQEFTQVFLHELLHRILQGFHWIIRLGMFSEIHLENLAGFSSRDSCVISFSDSSRSISRDCCFRSSFVFFSTYFLEISSGFPSFISTGSLYSQL